MDSRGPPAGPPAAAGPQVSSGAPRSGACKCQCCSAPSIGQGCPMSGRVVRFFSAAGWTPTPPARWRGRGLRAVRADGSVRPGARARGRGGARRGARRSASCGTSSSTSISRHSAAPRWSATARSRRTASSTTPAFRRPTCRRATRSSCRWRLAWAEVLGAEAIVHRRQRARLLGLSRLPAGVPRGVRDGWPRWRPGRRRRAAARDPRAAAAPVQGATSSARASRSGLDYGLTHSCYDPDPAGGAVRPCDSCRLRARGFAEAGVADPALRDRAGHDRTPLLHGSVPAEFDAERHARRATLTAGRAVVLDRTAFYPTSGGQPFDTGTLGDAARRRRRSTGTMA